MSTAEHLFDWHGFTATGMNRLTHSAGISSRTLYKHAGSKTSLVSLRYPTDEGIIISNQASVERQPREHHGTETLTILYRGSGAAAFQARR
ncbi:MAG: helix-turn-helix domain-containing protein [Halomonas sp.]|uniref:helix-turn-helix domain-containing protein n=1 Tax=unclassified Halomonas TaxID=2609666 RepID=UPI0020D15813|nr:helix-turn-helix domain-containing protein [Halomonas sp. JB37]